MDIKYKIDKIVNWLNKKKSESGTSGFVIGLSGGVDSAVCAALMKLADPDNSLCVILPIKSGLSDIKDAYEFANKIGIKVIEIDLTEQHRQIFEKTKETLEKVMDIDSEKYEKMVRLSDANLRARLRMSTLYTIANLKNYLVVGTDNAAEIYTGYFTKYGDGGVDILPISNLLKSEVYEYGRALGVTDAILSKVPSAGLWENQSDENEMGTKYAYIDAFLRGESIPQADLEIIQRMHRVTEHKRNIPARYNEGE